jgi:predicted Rossmann fold nucleotide-binding protein DprA/Smf involved in DNA uptake
MKRDPVSDALVAGLRSGIEKGLAALKEPKRETPMSAQVVDHLAKNGESTITAISETTGLRYFKVLASLGYLRKQGRVERVGRARYRLAGTP